MSTGSKVTEHEARAVAEAARETEWTKPSFVRELFLGRLRLELIQDVNLPDPDMQARGTAFLAGLDSFLREKVDAEAIDRDDRVPDETLRGLADLGAFGIKIPQEYGGLGLTQTYYNRAIALISSHSTALAVWLSAHQSIGVPQPLKVFGTEEQKEKYLPRVARGAVSAFALTEPDVGSDPARMGATAEPTPDGSAFILNGEKLWCTNGPVAELMVVMARTPAKTPGGRRGITAFIVENAWEGVETAFRSTFMGLRGIENGVIRFRNVRVPKENVIWGEGKGLKLALITLNTGRLTIPATCAAAGKWCLQVCRRWAAERQQWGMPIGRHDAVAQRLARMAANTFAMEAVSELAAELADAGRSDIRLEAAVAKMYNSELAWRLSDEALQVRGGRGYETADSLKTRGEAPIALERVMRDVRINMIFEGSSEIMRLFIAREAVDPHLQHAGAMADPAASTGAKAAGLLRLAVHFASWYPRLWFGWGRWPRFARFGRLATHLRYIERTSRKLCRKLFYAMARFGTSLEKKQATLNRLVDVGAELFAMAAACVRAHTLAAGPERNEHALELADLFCKDARRRCDRLLADVFRNDDRTAYAIAQQILAGQHEWLEAGIVPAPHGESAD